MVTYFIQSKLQDRAEKRKATVENIKKIHGPLFLEIKKVKENLLLNLDSSGLGSWTAIINQPEIFSVDTKLIEQITDFCKRVQNSISGKKNGITQIVSDIIYKNLCLTYFPSFNQKGFLSLERNGFSRSGFRIDLKNPSTTAYATIEKCAILKQNPLNILKEHPTFNMSEIHFVVKARAQVDEALVEQDYPILINNLVPKFNYFWKDILEKVHKNADVSKFDGERQELINIADKILKRLGKHIEKYIEIEKI